MLADCSRWDAACAGTAAERDGTKSLSPRRAALALSCQAVYMCTLKETAVIMSGCVHVYIEGDCCHHVRLCVHVYIEGDCCHHVRLCVHVYIEGD